MRTPGSIIPRVCCVFFAVSPVSGKGWYLAVTGGQLGPPSPPLISAAIGTSAATNTTLVSHSCVVVTADQTQAQCAMPEGGGTDYTWRLIVGGVAAVAPPLSTSYAPPTVSAVIVSGAAADADDVPTEGGATIVLVGSCFGPDPHAVTVLWNELPVPGVSLIVRHSLLSFPSPPGTGPRVTLRLVVSGLSTPPRSPLRYTAPSVDAIALQVMPRHEAVLDINGIQVSSGDVVMDCGVTTADGAPVVPGAVAVLVLTGRNYGAHPGVVGVVVGGSPCALLALSQTRVVCATTMCRGACRECANVADVVSAAVFEGVCFVLPPPSPFGQLTLRCARLACVCMCVYVCVCVCVQAQ